MMRRIFLGRKAQAITEYAILVSIVIGALIAMQAYVRNTLSAKIKLAADGIHEGQELLYQPKTTTSISEIIRREGIRSVTGDTAEYKIDITGAGTTVDKDFTETKFHPLGE